MLGHLVQSDCDVLGLQLLTGCGCQMYSFHPAGLDLHNSEKKQTLRLGVMPHVTFETLWGGPPIPVQVAAQALGDLVVRATLVALTHEWGVNK